MSCICIIPARGGSQRIPKKNIKEFHGKPILAYSIETAQKAGIFDAVFVSTDCEEIARVAVQFGANILWRDERHSLDEVGTQEVMKNALQEFTEREDPVEFACCLYATAPMLKPETLVDAHDILTTRSIDGAPFRMEIDYVVPVATWLKDPGQFYFGRVESFLAGVDLVGERTIMIKTDKGRECDINTMADWSVAEKMFRDLEDKNETC